MDNVNINQGDKEMKNLPKYKVEKNNSELIPYFIHGPKGSKYGLIRKQKTNGVLFSVNLKSKNFSSPERIKGFQYFSDIGDLGPISDECVLRLS